MLLESDADINQATSNGSCLHEAALYGKTDVVKFLLDVSKSIITPFLWFLCSFSSASHDLTGLKIIFERWPVVLTDQTNFSSVMSHF